RRAENELRTRQLRLQRAQQVARMGDWSYDVASDRITWSPEVFRLYERDPSLGPPRSFEEELAYYDEPDRKALSAGVQHALLTGEETVVRKHLNLPSGGEAWHEAVIRCERGEGGRVVQLFGTVQDVTERTRAEAERAELLARVERARDEAERANRSKD